MVLTKRIKRIHFVGVGGAGVSSLANLMLEMGYEVSGSDLVPSVVTQGLKAKGALIFDGHDARHVRRADLVVISTAIPETNVEVVTAKQMNVPVLSRIDFLSYLSERKFCISVSGSHGKSTTSAMIAVVFYYADLDPTIVLGAQVKHLFGSSRLGKSEYFICEGDESNNSMLRFSPKVAVVTNIDDDHLDFHGTLENLKLSFHNFLNNGNREGISVFSLDDPILREMSPSIKKTAITYGLSEEADFRATNVKLRLDRSTFKVIKRGYGELGEVTLRTPGTYNVRNALATIAVSDYCGIDFGTVAFGLENFPGVRRRFEKLLDREDVTIIDDYAHHPSEILALMEAVSVYKDRRVRVIFQPHRYTRSQRLASKFPHAFEMADEVILTDIYSAFEAPINGVTSEYLYSFFERELEPDRVKLMLNQKDALKYIRDTISYGDVILTVGAGDIYFLGYELQGILKDFKLPKGILPKGIPKKKTHGSGKKAVTSKLPYDGD